jgi:hypothetical protein
MWPCWAQLLPWWLLAARLRCRRYARHADALWLLKHPLLLQHLLL